MTSGKTVPIIIAIFVVVVLAVFGPPPKHASMGNTLVVLSESPPDYLDPGMSYQVVSWETMVNVYNGLLTYRKVEGIPGSQLVPDLATAMPTVSDGGKTYSFTMRKGVMWGPPLHREVKPSDIKYAIERDFAMASPGQGFYTGIEGADAVVAKKAKEVSGIVVDDSARTITFHLTAPDATFLYKVALPFAFAVPKGTPAKDQSMSGFVPATGPYMFTKYTPQRLIEFKRNPNYRQWTPDTPPGHVDGVRIKIGVNPENSITLIKQGKADFMFGAIPRSKLPMLLHDDKLKAQVHIDKDASTSYIFMNTQKGPFTNKYARQAINWAIDRRAMIKLGGGMGVPTETILPPNMPGFADHNFYPGPDIAKAKALIAKSGITPGKIDIWCRTNEPNPTLAVYLQGVMAQLGFTPTVKCVDSSSYFTLIGNQQTGAQIGFANWGQDFPEGSDFIDVLLNGQRITTENSNNYAWYKGADKEIAAANALLDQDARNKAWGKLDAQISEDAPWAAYSHSILYTFTSKRLGNYVQSPVYGLLFGQVQLKGEEEHPVGRPALVAGGGTDGTSLIAAAPADADPATAAAEMGSPLTDSDGSFIGTPWRTSLQPMRASGGAPTMKLSDAKLMQLGAMGS